MRIGLVENLSMKEYRDDPAYSSSDFIAMGESLKKWKYFKDNPKPPTRAMEVGSATHHLLECRLFDKMASEIAVYEEGSSKTKGFEKFKAEKPGVYCLDEDEFFLAQRLVTAIVEEPECIKYLKGALAEPSFFVKDPEFGFGRKCRPDFLHVQQGVSINIKTTSDASEHGFVKSIADFAYDWQTVNYQDVLRLHYDRLFDEVHILAEKAAEGPIIARIRAIDDDTLDQARAQLHFLFQRIAECEKSGKWEDPGARLEIAQVPLWARRLVQL